MKKMVFSFLLSQISLLEPRPFVADRTRWCGCDCVVCRERRVEGHACGIAKG